MIKNQNCIGFRRNIILKTGSYIPKNVLISKSNSLHLFFVLYNQHPATSSQCSRSSRYSKFKQSHLTQLNSISYNSNLYGYKIYQICSAKFQISRICVRTQINCVTHLALIQFIWINGKPSNISPISNTHESEVVFYRKSYFKWFIR